MNALALAALSAFNLVCSGESYYVAKMLGPRQSVATFTETYRVDLESKRWCVKSCPTTRDLAEVTDRFITFVHEDRGDMNDTDTIVSRESGHYMSRTRLGEFMSLQEGQCVKQPFAGFPPRKF